MNFMAARATTARCASGYKNRVNKPKITVANRKTNLPTPYMARGWKRDFLSTTSF